MALVLERPADQTERKPCKATPLGMLAASLRQLGAVLAAASDEQYVQNPVGVIESSLGGHVRHCLDHFQAWLDAVGDGTVNYDRRARGTVIETNRVAALAALHRIEDRINELECDLLEQSVRVATMLSHDGCWIESDSTVGRELAFVLSHTIHHSAIVAAMCRMLGISLPSWFGYAPASIAHLERAGCAPSP